MTHIVSNFKQLVANASALFNNCHKNYSSLERLGKPVNTLYTNVLISVPFRYKVKTIFFKKIPPEHWFG